MYSITGSQIDALDIIMRNQIALLDGRLARGEITRKRHTTLLRQMVEAVS